MQRSGTLNQATEKMRKGGALYFAYPCNESGVAWKVTGHGKKKFGTEFIKVRAFV